MNNIKALITAFFLSMLPIIELRGGIPVAMGLENSFWAAYPVCVVGNMLPIPFILLFAKKTLNWFAEKRDMKITSQNSFMIFFQKTVRWFGKVCNKIIVRAEEKAKTIGTYELWGLFIFVAIPLPGTGAWTGALIATILRLRIWKALLAIFLGVLTSGIIMGILSFGLFSII